MQAELSISADLRERVVRTWAGREIGGQRPTKSRDGDKVVYRLGEVTLTYTPSDGSGNVLLEGPASSLPIFAGATHRLVDLARGRNFSCVVNLRIPCPSLSQHMPADKFTPAEWVEFRLLWTRSIKDHGVRRAQGAIAYPDGSVRSRHGRPAPRFKRADIIVTIDSDSNLLSIENHRFAFARDVVRLMQLLEGRFFHKLRSLPPDLR